MADEDNPNTPDNPENPEDTNEETPSPDNPPAPPSDGEPPATTGGDDEDPGEQPDANEN